MERINQKLIKTVIYRDGKGHSRRIEVRPRFTITLNHLNVLNIHNKIKSNFKGGKAYSLKLT